LSHCLTVASDHALRGSTTSSVRADSPGYPPKVNTRKIQHTQPNSRCGHFRPDPPPRVREAGMDRALRQDQTLQHATDPRKATPPTHPSHAPMFQLQHSTRNRPDWKLLSSCRSSVDDMTSLSTTMTTSPRLSSLPPHAGAKTSGAISCSFEKFPREKLWKEERRKKKSLLKGATYQQHDKRFARGVHCNPA
jgi:hypothetical protein